MDKANFPELEKYDVIQLSLTCLSGVVRKQTITAKDLREILRGSATVTFSSCGIPQNSLLYDETSSMGAAKVDLSSLAPLPWLSVDGLRSGGVSCEIAPPPDKPDAILSPRTSAVRQVERLKSDFGLTIKSAFEAEYMIFEKDTTTPFNNVLFEPYARSDTMSGKEDALLGTCHSLQEAGLPVETFMSEFAAAQFELTFKPSEGMAPAETIMVMKDGMKTCLGKHDLVPTYMACPTAKGHANGFHFNHSLWTDEGSNAFLDLSNNAHTSEAALHWIAGLVHHAPALTALFCPTINCYRRLDDDLSPSNATWAIEDRSTYLRLKTERKNVYVENRLPSSASNPYLAVAGTMAAGIDGLARKLTCPPQNDKSAPPIPRTLDEAVSNLEKDTVLTKALGEDMVKAYIDIARKSIKAKNEGDLGKFECQRSIYFHCI